MQPLKRKPWYVEWFDSSFYHNLYSDRDEKEAADFIHPLIDYLKPIPGSKMLDVACGRGRHARVLASMGYDVTGTDLSPSSISYAKKIEKDNLEFFIHDMRLPFWINYFDYVFNFFTSFGYFRTKREHDDAIRTIASSLKEEGTFVIDYLNVHYIEKNLVPENIKKINDVIYNIRRWCDDTHFYKKIVITDPKLSHPVEFTEQVAKFTLGDFTDMLSFRGMQIVDVFGDYQLNAYDTEKTPRMIIVAKKIKQ